jgi:hypothetical protein
MAFTGNFFCTSFKDELLEGAHDLRTSAAGGDAFKLAMYTNTASFTETVTQYTSTNEITGTGYTAGGGSLVNLGVVISGTTAYADFQDLIFSTATITAFGALIYNTTPNGSLTNPTLVVLDFGGARTSTAGDFTIVFPNPGASTAIIRIA